MELKPGYKQTEVGVIPLDWEVKQLGTFTDCTSGGTPSTLISSYWGGKIPWMSSGELHLKRVKNVEGRITDLGLNNSSTKIIPKNCVLIGLAGQGKTRGTVAINSIELCTNQSVAAIFPRSSFDSEYLFHNLDARYDELRDLSSGDGGRGGLNLTILKGLQIPFPSIEEQTAIATVLSDMDALLDSLDRLIAKKRDIKQAAMQELLTGKTRLPGFEGEWEVKRLGDIANIQRGASPRPIDSPVWFDRNSTVGWVRIADITNAGRFLNETTQRLSSLGVKESRPVAAGSLIMSICATVGRPIITNIDVCIHDGFVVFGKLETDLMFIYYVLKWIEPDWSKHGQTGSQMNLNTGLINGTKIKLPSLSEQTAIAKVLSDMDAEIEALEERRTKTQNIKQGMMQELLTGKTRLIAQEG